MIMIIIIWSYGNAAIGGDTIEQWLQENGNTSLKITCEKWNIFERIAEHTRALIIYVPEYKLFVSVCVCYFKM